VHHTERGGYLPAAITPSQRLAKLPDDAVEMDYIEQGRRLVQGGWANALRSNIDMHCVSAYYKYQRFLFVLLGHPEATIVDLSDVFHTEHLRVADLKGREVKLKIAGFEKRDFDDGAKLVLLFHNTDRTFICNKTNANTIADMYGSRVDNWVDKPITLMPSQTDFQGKSVQCIRVKATAPEQAPPPPPEPVRDEQGDIPF
jgi:hypothetical protein